MTSATKKMRERYFEYTRLAATTIFELDRFRQQRKKRRKLVELESNFWNAYLPKIDTQVNQSTPMNREISKMFTNKIE